LDQLRHCGPPAPEEQSPQFDPPEIAAVPKDEFEAAVESNDPPTMEALTALIERATTEREVSGKRAIPGKARQARQEIKNWQRPLLPTPRRGRWKPP
jgi:hypothetical protein